MLPLGRHCCFVCINLAATPQQCFPLLQTGTDYGPFIANEPSPMHTTTLVDCCTRKLVADWRYMRENVSPGGSPVLLCQHSRERLARGWRGWLPQHACRREAHAAMAVAASGDSRQGCTDPCALSTLLHVASGLCVAGRGAASAVPGLLHVWAHD